MSAPTPKEVDDARGDPVALAAFVAAIGAPSFLVEAIASLSGPKQTPPRGRPSTKDENGIPAKQKDAATVLQDYRNERIGRREALEKILAIYPHSPARAHRILVGSDTPINNARRKLFGEPRTHI